VVSYYDHFDESIRYAKSVMQLIDLPKCCSGMGLRSGVHMRRSISEKDVGGMRKAAYGIKW
jgi:hypothetical protein